MCHIDIFGFRYMYVYIFVRAYTVRSLHLLQVPYVYTCTICHIDMYAYICMYVCMYTSACAYIVRSLQVPYQLLTLHCVARTMDICARSTYAHALHIRRVRIHTACANMCTYVLRAHVRRCDIGWHL